MKDIEVKVFFLCKKKYTVREVIRVKYIKKDSMYTNAFKVIFSMRT